MSEPRKPRSAADMLHEAVVLLTAHARENGNAIPQEKTDVEQLLILARSIRFGWEQR